ncbi:DUF420 domain-containing protein [Oligoflexaceae bacterium]|nr:DUF420 domain-containing protein [Oligoflexaceae bacterium]
MFAEFFPQSGFLSRSTFVIDLITIGLIFVLPVLIWSVIQARKGRYESHRRTQTALFLLLGILVLAFEWELHTVNWRKGAEASPYFDGILFPFLKIHLVFAISTSFFWLITFVSAFFAFPRPARPTRFSRAHKTIARITVVDTFFTSVTGWTFYYLAFIA